MYGNELLSESKTMEILWKHFRGVLRVLFWPGLLPGGGPKAGACRCPPPIPFWHPNPFRTIGRTAALHIAPLPPSPRLGGGSQEPAGRRGKWGRGAAGKEPRSAAAGLQCSLARRGGRSRARRGVPNWPLALCGPEAPCPAN